MADDTVIYSHLLSDILHRD